ncbi:hypothetical protein [Actinoplanes sp. GCM10030250]|uniref:hypothetical protein n=1 Tax=Actinoplanes sp. GCM10030250 TaxID=3273376 RepID=UPI00361061E8
MSRFVLPDEMRKGTTNGRAARPARAPRRPAQRHPQQRTPFRHGFVMGLCVGVTLALVFAIGVFLVVRPTAAPVASAPAETAAPAGNQPQAAVDLKLRHLGDLKLQIEAQVSAPGSYDPIAKGQVAAFVDMVAMPQSHLQGPIVMAEVGGRPGVYQALTSVSMVGEYAVTIEVRQPMATKAHARIKIDTV